MAFLKDLLLIPVVLGAIAFFTQSLTTAERVACELKDDQLYTCIAQDHMFGMNISESKAEKVLNIDYDLKCSKSSKSRGCTAIASFQTEGGIPIQMSKRYKGPDQVRKMTETLNSLINEKNAFIDMTFPPSLFSVILVDIFAIVFSIFIISNALENFRG